jgi:Mg-chelatase subunit ChlD
MTGASATISYRPRERAEGAVIGEHRGRSGGGQGVFLDQVSYLRQPDPRRIDLRLTLRDPFENVYVRRFEQRLAIALYAVVDLSKSMSFEGTAQKMALVEELCLSLARSAHELGDAFGIIGCDTEVREDFLLTATRNRGTESEIARRFKAFVPQGRSVAGLAQAAIYLAGKRKLVFLISDFRMPVAEIERSLESLSRHDIVPILVSDSAEENDLPRFGLIDVRDLESGAGKLVFMRPALRRHWLAEAEARRRTLDHLFLRYGRPAFELKDRFDADALSRYLLDI